MAKLKIVNRTPILEAATQNKGGKNTSRLDPDQLLRDLKNKYSKEEEAQRLLWGLIKPDEQYNDVKEAWRYIEEYFIKAPYEDLDKKVLCLVGMFGTGKTTGIVKAVKKAGLAYTTINLESTTVSEEIYGMNYPSEKGGTIQRIPNFIKSIDDIEIRSEMLAMIREVHKLSGEIEEISQELVSKNVWEMGEAEEKRRIRKEKSRKAEELKEEIRKLSHNIVLIIDEANRAGALTMNVLSRLGNDSQEVDGIIYEFKVVVIVNPTFTDSKIMQEIMEGNTKRRTINLVAVPINREDLINKLKKNFPDFVPFIDSIEDSLLSTRALYQYEVGFDVIVNIFRSIINWTELYIKEIQEKGRSPENYKESIIKRVYERTFNKLMNADAEIESVDKDLNRLLVSAIDFYVNKRLGNIDPDEVMEEINSLLEQIKKRDVNLEVYSANLLSLAASIKRNLNQFSKDQKIELKDKIDSIVLELTDKSKREVGDVERTMTKTLDELSRDLGKI